MEKRPSKEQLATFKKNANDPSISAEIRAKFQAIVDKFENVGEEVVDAVEGKKERKPRTPKATTQRKPRATKQTADDIEKAKAEIKARTGKTEEECEKIVEEYRALRTKSQERKKKEAEASKTNVERINKLKKEDKVIEGTNEKTADAVIETTTKDVADKIEKQIEAVEEKAETEAKKEVEKEMPKVSATEKKKAVKEKVEEKVKEKTKTIVKRVVIDTSALLTTIAESLGKFDKDSQKEFLIKLRSDIDKLISKYSFGGLTDGGVQVMNIQQSNLSSSSVNPTMFGGGGGVEGIGVIEKFFELDTKYSKNAQKGELVYVHKQYRNDKLFLQRIITKDNVLKSIERKIDKRNPIIKIIPQKIDDSGYMKFNLTEFNGDILEITYNDSNIKDIYTKVQVFGNGGGVGEKEIYFIDWANKTPKLRELQNTFNLQSISFTFSKQDAIADAINNRHIWNLVIIKGNVGYDVYKYNPKTFNPLDYGGSKMFVNGGGVEAPSEEDAKKELEKLESEGKITLSIGNHGLIFMQIVKTGNAMVSSFKKSYESYLDALKHYYRVTNRFTNGGGVGEWKIGDKFRVLKGIYGDYNSPRYANKEFEVINIRDGKYIDARTPNGTTETFDIKNIEKIKKYENGGAVSSDQRRKGYVHGYKFDNPNDRETFTNYLEREDIDYYTRNGVVATKMAISNKELRKIGISQEFSEFGNGGGIKDVIVYDNGGESFDRYTIFTPDGSVYGMSSDASGFNQYLGDNTEVEQGSHLGKRLKSVPKSIEKAVMQRMNDSYSVGGGVEGNKRDKYNKLIGRRDNEFYFLDDIFHYEDGFKGATGSVVVPVNKTYYDYATSYDGILERYMDAMGEDEWLDTLGYQREDFEDEDEMISAIEDGIWQTYLNGGLEPFEEVSYDLEEQMRNLPEFSDSDEFPLFEIIGGGRVFDKDRTFDEIYDQELYNKIREVEEFKRGGNVYSRSWHQDHSRHNKRENYEKPMSERSKKFAKGGMSEHGLRIGDEIIRDYSEFGFNEVQIKDAYGKNHVVSLESGKRSEPFAKGGSTEYNRSWHQDHSRHNKRENYEVPMSSRKKAHGGTIEERMRMRRGM